MKNTASDRTGLSRLEISFSFKPKNRRKSDNHPYEVHRTIKPGNPPRVSKLMALAIRFDGLVRRGDVRDDKPARIPISAIVWQCIDAVRLSGQTNMLDRPVVARLAGELGYPDAARWIEEHPKEYAEGVFRGFVVDPQGGKS